MKNYSAQTIAELDESHISPVLFVQVELDNRTDRYCTAKAAIDWDGHSWYGVGGILGIDAITESDDLVAHGMRFTINGLSQASSAAFLSDKVQGRKCTCWLGLIGATGIVESPEIEYVGRLDAPQRLLSSEGVVISMPVESRMLRWALAAGVRMTDAEQRRRYPSDRFFSHMARMAESIELEWPNRKHYFQ